MTSHQFPSLATSGPRAIGPGATMVITGFPEPGCSRRRKAYCGRPDIGAMTRTATTPGTMGIGATTSVITAGSIMDTVTRATATPAATGRATTSTTTMQ